METLVTELATYESLLPSLLKDQGKFALISGDSLLGTFVSYEDALKIGYEKCGVKPFLVKSISHDEKIAYFTRDLSIPCQA